MTQITLLGRLRRYARILTGSQNAGDELLRNSMTPSFQPRLGDVGSDAAFLSAIRQLELDYFGDVEFHPDDSAALSSIERSSLVELSELAPDHRAVLALVSIDKISVERVAGVLGLEPDTVSLMIDINRDSLPTRTRPILAHVAAEGGEAAFASIASGLGYEFRFEPDVDLLDDRLQESRYDAIVYDEDDLTDEGELISEIAHRRGIGAVNIEDVLEPSALSSAGSDYGRVVNEDILQEKLDDILFYEPHRWVSGDETFRLLSDEPEPLDVSDAQLAPVPAPIDAEVVDEQLRIAPADAPDAVVPFSALDGVRRQHAEEARFLAGEARSSNGSPLVERKLEALAEILERALTEDTVIALVVGIDGYARLLPTIQEEFMSLAAADMASFVYDIQGFTNQFPVARQFRAEAEAARPITAEEEAALQSVVTVLLEQPDEIVAPAVKTQFATLQSARAVQAGSLVSDVGWLRSVSNSLKAVARYAKTFGRDVHADARGKAVEGMSALIVALPVAYGLQLLSVSYPVQFAALTVLLSRSRKQIESTFGGGDDEK